MYIIDVTYNIYAIYVVDNLNVRWQPYTPVSIKQSSRICVNRLHQSTEVFESTKTNNTNQTVNIFRGILYIKWKHIVLLKQATGLHL